MLLLARVWIWLWAITLSGTATVATPAAGRGRDDGPARSAPSFPRARAAAATGADRHVLDDIMGALRVLQETYFEPWQGTWPTAIDWTAAVVGTHVSGALSSLSNALNDQGFSSTDDKERENLIALYFSQVLGFYFGQNDVALRGQAFDDMLWVVLGWLETVKFIDLHTHLYYPTGAPRVLPGQQQLMDESTGRTYFGNVWTPAFAHRARIFWELAAKGWDTKWCGGGMNWNPRLQVYKNAITNELFVAASVAMYLHFPGDDNESPFSLPGGRRSSHPRRDVKHLDAAVAGHIWLRNSGMRNGPGQEPEGLYVDGFHISGWGDPSSNNTACDVRNTMVYTYNQGVILTGLRGLWDVKGNESYIHEGHDLIRATIKATGYDLSRDRPVDDLSRLKPGELPLWHGLGRAGVLEDQCDVSGSCSQDSQTFKGILFHHLVAFCSTLQGSSASTALKKSHASSCASYRGWVEHNAKAAQATRDDKGLFGMWWTAGLLEIVTEDLKESEFGFRRRLIEESVDYRTYGVPDSPEWVPAGYHQNSTSSPSTGPDGENGEDKEGGSHADTRWKPVDVGAGQATMSRRNQRKGSDPNTRGRGRTLETQSGGLAVLRAVWEFSNIS